MESEVLSALLALLLYFLYYPLLSAVMLFLSLFYRYYFNRAVWLMIMFGRRRIEYRYIWDICVCNLVMIYGVRRRQNIHLTL